MRIVLKMIVESDDAHAENETELVRFERGNHLEERPPGLGMTMKEAKSLLAATQHAIVIAQSQRIVGEASHCADCGAPLKVKDRRQIVYRTLFGKVRLSSPRLSTCPCRGANSKHSFSPLASVLTDRSHPELLYLTTRWASILSYGTTSILLADVLPIDEAMSCSSIRNAVRRIGRRLDERARSRSVPHLPNPRERNWTGHTESSVAISSPSNSMRATFAALIAPRQDHGGSARRWLGWSAQKVRACAMRSSAKG